MSEKYTFKIPTKLKELFETYIKQNDELGFNTVSQFIMFVLQEKAFEIRNSVKEKKK